jgi:succinyl-CoA synthetase beta subunit
MRLFEYQGKELFDEAGLAIPRGVTVQSTDALDAALKQIGAPCVVKAQVLSGGRGKAGLIKVCTSETEARGYATSLFESDQRVPALLIEEAVDIVQELYLSVSIDPVAPGAVFMACAEGGVEIETLAQESPEKIHRERIDLTRGLLSFQARNLAYAMELDKEQTKAVAKVAGQLYKVFSDNDAELAEINPLFVTSDGRVIAGDAKVIIDDSALYRQPGFEATQDHFTSALEFEAAQEGIPFLEFDGEIGLMCAGAGLTTTVYDLIHYAGGTVANYLEFGGPNYRKAVRAMELCLKADSKVILVVTFGTIARADVMANGIVEAIERLAPDRPIVTCIRGTNEEDATEILAKAGLEPLFDTEEAVARAVAISKERSA